MGQVVGGAWDEASGGRDLGTRLVGSGRRSLTPSHCKDFRSIYSFFFGSHGGELGSEDSTQSGHKVC